MNDYEACKNSERFLVGKREIVSPSANFMRRHNLDEIALPET